MSYCRGNVYIYGAFNRIECCSCKLQSVQKIPFTDDFIDRFPRGILKPGSTWTYYPNWSSRSRRAVMLHVKQHIAHGHKFDNDGPKYVLKRLQEELEERGDRYYPRKREIRKSWLDREREFHQTLGKKPELSAFRLWLEWKREENEV